MARRADKMGMDKNTNSKPYTGQHGPADRYLRHADGIETLIEQIAAKRFGQPVKPHFRLPEEVGWGDVTEIAAAHEHLTIAAYHLGAITIEQAKNEHGVTL